jgi:hypothetical protein
MTTECEKKVREKREKIEIIKEFIIKWVGKNLMQIINTTHASTPTQTPRPNEEGVAGEKGILRTPTSSMTVP